jgi:hypothetical protein
MRHRNDNNRYNDIYYVYFEHYQINIRRRKKFDLSQPDHEKP